MLNNEKQLDTAIRITAVLIIIGVALSGYFFYKNRISLKYKNPPIIDQQIETLEKQISKSPGNFDLRIMIAKRLLDRDRISEAIGHLKEASKIKKKSIAANYLLGFAYKEQDNSTGAEKQFLETLKIAKKEQFSGINTFVRDANYYLANIYEDGKKYKKAIKYYKAASDIGTADSDTLYKIGQLYVKDSDYKTAMTYFDKALMFVPNYKEVLEDYQKAIEKAPNYAPGYYGLGKAYNLLGQISDRAGKDEDAKTYYDKARTFFKSTLKKDPSHKDAKKDLVNVGKLEEVK